MSLELRGFLTTILSNPNLDPKERRVLEPLHKINEGLLTGQTPSETSLRKIPLSVLNLKQGTYNAFSRGGVRTLDQALALGEVLSSGRIKMREIGINKASELWATLKDYQQRLLPNQTEAFESHEAEIARFWDNPLMNDELKIKLIINMGITTLADVANFNEEDLQKDRIFPRAYDLTHQDIELLILNRNLLSS